MPRVYALVKMFLDGVESLWHAADGRCRAPVDFCSMWLQLPMTQIFGVVVRSCSRWRIFHPGLFAPACFANMPAMPLTPLGAKFVPSKRDSASLLPAFAL
jgi:hypothetical protein